MPDQNIWHGDNSGGIWGVSSANNLVGGYYDANGNWIQYGSGGTFSGGSGGGSSGSGGINTGGVDWSQGAGGAGGTGAGSFRHQMLIDDPFGGGFGGGFSGWNGGWGDNNNSFGNASKGISYNSLTMGPLASNFSGLSFPNMSMDMNSFLYF